MSNFKDFQKKIKEKGTGAANRRNYELIIFDDGKFTSKYFNSTEEIKTYFENA